MVSWGGRIGACVTALGMLAACSSSERSAEPAAAGPPGTVTTWTALIRDSEPRQVDLLLVVDTSEGMREKQRLLADAVPWLLARFITPRCVDPAGQPTGASLDAGGRCQDGSPEIEPVSDLHVAVVSASLGAHGGTTCAASNGVITDDHAQLLPTVRTGLSSSNEEGFLVWDPGQAAVPPGETNASRLAADASAHVVSAGDGGCWYQAPLEAWYRFLVDPEPVRDVTNDQRSSVRFTVNDVVLRQRKAFLRPQSQLGILLLTQQNDCSILDEDGYQGWLVGNAGSNDNWRMPRGSSACLVPDDPCCRPCSSPPQAGCPSNEADPACSQGETLGTVDDSLRLRCFQMTRRFGIDLLYPVERYAEGLSSSFITPRSGSDQVPNALYAGGREPSSVILAAIVGVPWQDIATNASLTDPVTLKFMGADELSAEGRWELLLGDPATGRPPTDPFMVESSSPRESDAAHPLFPDDPAYRTSAPSEPMNRINGHELVAGIQAFDELQYACTFPMPAEPCHDGNAATCACNADERGRERPTCEYADTAGDGTQIYDKAYPGTRLLEVLKQVGSQGAVASACPKNVAGDAGAFEGYRPAMDALADPLVKNLSYRCLPRRIPADAEGRVACKAFEFVAGGDCSCAAEGRSEVPSGVRANLQVWLRNQGVCGGAALSCDDLCACELAQHAGAELTACQNDGGVLESAGFCYVDPAAGVGDPVLTAACSAGQGGRFRFTGADTPARGADVVWTCLDYHPEAG